MMRNLNKKSKNKERPSIVKDRVGCFPKDSRNSFEKELEKLKMFRKMTKFAAGIVFSLSLVARGLAVDVVLNMLSKNSKTIQGDQTINYQAPVREKDKDNIIAVIDYFGQNPKQLQSKRFIDKLGNGWNGKDITEHGIDVVREVDKTLDELGNAVGAEYTKDVKIMPINLNNSYFNGDLSKSIIWAVDKGADVINISLGENKYDEKLQKAVDYACKNDVIVVAAAGNYGDYKECYPAQNEGVISVAAISDKSESGQYELALDSELNEGVDFCAIEADTPGTSFTAPDVAAKVDVIEQKIQEKGIKPTVDIVTEAAKNAADHGNVANRDNKIGWGIIDVKKAFDNIDNGKIPKGSDIEGPHVIFERNGTNVSLKFYDDKGNVDTVNLKSKIKSCKVNGEKKEENIELAEKDGQFTANLGDLSDGKYKITVKGVKDSAGNGADEITRRFNIDTKPIEFNTTFKIADNNKAVEFYLNAKDEFGVEYATLLNHKLYMFDGSNGLQGNEFFESFSNAQIPSTVKVNQSLLNDGLNILELRANDGTYAKKIKYVISKEKGEIAKVTQLSELMEDYDEMKFFKDNSENG